MNIDKKFFMALTMGLSISVLILSVCAYQLNENLVSKNLEISILLTDSEDSNRNQVLENKNSPAFIYKVEQRYLDNSLHGGIEDKFKVQAQQSDQEENVQPNTILQNNTLISSLINNALVPDLSSLLSVIIRTTIVASLVFLIVKWLGGKGIGQLSPFGLLIVVGLGSAIGDPMIYKDISITQAMVAVIIAVVFFKAIDYLTLKSKRFRKSVEPRPITLIEYGSVDKAGLKKAKMGFTEFEVQMRLSGIEYVDEIKFARMEPNRQVSLIRKKNRII